MNELNFVILCTLSVQYDDISCNFAHTIVYFFMKDIVSYNLPGIYYLLHLCENYQYSTWNTNGLWNHDIAILELFFLFISKLL